MSYVRPTEKQHSRRAVLEARCIVLRSAPGQAVLLTLNSLGLSQAPKRQKPLCSQRLTSGRKIAELSLSYQVNQKPRVLGQAQSLESGSRPHPAWPKPFPIFFSLHPDTNSPFVFCFGFFCVFFAELDYRNSYEIEYMEKIGSSLPVSSTSGP